MTVPGKKAGEDMTYLMWYYVYSACADPGIFAKGGEVWGGGGLEGAQAHLTEKATLSENHNTDKVFCCCFYSPYLQLFKQFYRGGSFFLFFVV